MTPEFKKVVEVAKRKLRKRAKGEKLLVPELDVEDMRLWFELNEVCEDFQFLVRKAENQKKLVDAKSTLFWDHLKKKYERMEIEELSTERVIGVRHDEESDKIIGVSTEGIESPLDALRKGLGL